MEKQTTGVVEESTLVSENNSTEEVKNIFSSAENSEAPIGQREIKYGKIVSLSWDIFKNNAKFLLLLTLTYLGIRILEGVLQEAVEKSSLATLIFGITFLVLDILISIGLIQVFLKISRSQKAEIKELIGNKRYFWKFLGGSILYVLIILGGLILLIVPGIIWAYKYTLFAYFIVDKDMDVVQALKASADSMQGFKWKLFLLQLLMLAVLFAGILCLGVGVLVSLIIISLMSAFFYRVLVGEKVYS
ncbi:MAG: hypothetical protein ACD_67C00071G0001 [uncultured bacterium]|nr:MAG: hypothetical protein ACD_67C00071G0001 [uncultured bacterium]